MYDKEIFIVNMFFTSINISKYDIYLKKRLKSKCNLLQLLLNSIIYIVVNVGRPTRSTCARDMGYAETLKKHMDSLITHVF